MMADGGTNPFRDMGIKPENRTILRGWRLKRLSPPRAHPGKQYSEQTTGKS